MAKNITVTSIDGMNLADKSNMNPEQPRKKMKMIHEQVFEQYGIDPQKVFERTGLLKNIPHEWIHEIITLNINTCKTQKNYININLQDRVAVLGFEAPEICEQFYQEFNTNMSRAINAYLASINEDPKKYNRIIVIESSVDSQQISLRF